MPVISIPEAIEIYRQGRFLIIVDDEDRENEGDLAMAADAITPEAVAFMARYASGLICTPMTGPDLDRLNLPMMVDPERNGARFGTAFTISVEAREGVSTGISAHDRARTISVLTDPECQPGEIVQPGHIFPLRYHPGGVLARGGQTEASVDMAVLSGHLPSAVICEIMNDDGTMSRMPELEAFSEEHDIPIITIADLVEYRKHHAMPAFFDAGDDGRTIERVNNVPLPTNHGPFHLYTYRDRKARPDSQPHLALVAGDLSGPAPVVTRVHSECLTGDVFGSARCDCGDQLELAMQAIASEGRGVIIYLRQEGRGIGLLNKIRAYELQDEGLDTVEANHQLGFPADARDYRIAAEMLLDLGVTDVSLLTNNPAKIAGLETYGVTVSGRVPLTVEPGEGNGRYLETKRVKMGHMIDLPVKVG